MTRQNSPQRFILEFISADPARHRVRFTLRRDRRAARARTFNAHVEHDGAPGIVRLTAETLAADAVPDGGPLLAAAAPFTLEFVWDPADSSRLTGCGADFSFTFQAGTAAALRAALAVPEPKSAGSGDVAPGNRYRGLLGSGPDAPGILLTFVAGDAGALEARFEGKGWSMNYAVRRTPELVGGAAELMLEPVAVPMLAGRESSAVEAWPRLRLRLDGRDLVGVIENGATAAPLRLRPEDDAVATATAPSAGAPA